LNRDSLFLPSGQDTLVFCSGHKPPTLCSYKLHIPESMMPFPLSTCHSLVLSVESKFGKELDSVNGMLATNDEKNCVLCVLCASTTYSEGTPREIRLEPTVPIPREIQRENSGSRWLAKIRLFWFEVEDQFRNRFRHIRINQNQCSKLLY
jgi:hypothetical protein